MDDSSGHPNDAIKIAAATAASSSSDVSSSSDDSSDDSSNDREDGARSAQTGGCGKDLHFKEDLGFGQCKRVRLVAPSADESSEDSSNDHNEGAHSATRTGCEKNLAGKQLRRVLPTAKNRSTKSVARDVAQCVYFDVFSTHARHKLPEAEEFDEILAAVKSVTTDVTSKRSGSTNCMSQLNSEVSSWNTKRQIFPSSSLIFNKSIHEDGLSSQSIYYVRFDNPHHIESIAPNPKVLYNSLPSNEDMNKSYEILVKAINDLRIQSSSNNTLSDIDRHGCTFNNNIAEMHARCCLNIDDVEFHEWASESKFAHFWYCQDLCHSEILKLSIKNAIINLHMIWYKDACFKMRQTDNAISSLGLCHHTQLGKLLIHSTYTVLLSFIQSRGKTPLSHAL